MTTQCRIRNRARISLLTVFATGALAPLTALPARAEKAVAPEKNPPGDIPITQVFVFQRSSAGNALRGPEGWAPRKGEPNARFVDKLDIVKETLSQAPANVDLAWLKNSDLPAAEKQGRADKLGTVTLENPAAGRTVRIAHADNAEPNSFTGKQVRLEHNLYLFAQGGKLAALNLSAPPGVDNVGHWRRMSRFFGGR